MIVAFIIFLILLGLIVWSLPLIYDYRFTPQGIDIVAFGGIMRITTLKKCEIKSIRTEKLFDGALVWKRLMGLSLGNRLRSSVLAVETTRFPRIWYLTPSSPDLAMNQLEWCQDESMPPAASPSPSSCETGRGSISASDK